MWGVGLLILLLLPSNSIWADHPDSRWVVGDMHIHTEASQLPNRPAISLEPDEILREMESQKLEVTSVLIWGVRPGLTARHFTGRDWGAGSRIIHYDLENSSFPGGRPDHMIALGLKSWNFPQHLYSYPIHEWAFQQDAIVGVAHASHWTSAFDQYPDRTIQVPADFPICLALGQKLFLSTELINHPSALFLWYNLLNLGFEIPLTAGSDWPVAGSHAGEARTYVQVSGQLTYRKWIEGIRDGRTVVGRGLEDFVEMKAHGLPIGSRLEWAAPGELDLEIGYHSTREQKLEVIRNGQVIHSRQIGPGEGELTHKVKIDDSSWIAVRTEWAHTGATYVEIGGQPIRTSVESAEYFIRYTDELIRQIKLDGFALHDTPADVVARERADAIRMFSPAKKVFQQLLKEIRDRQL
jgi:hypothetical protein